MPYISLSSMGLDIADVNNDGWPDIYVADMLPDDERRLKTTTSFENWHRLQDEVTNGFHYQFTRNMLHLNHGDGTFSDIGQMAGVARTDWSWSPLIADLDLDGYKDIYVTNGLAKDVTSQEYIAFLRSRETMVQATRGARVDFQRLVDAMSSTKLPNYAFRNRGDSTFANASASWGLDTPSFSSGAAYGDLARYPAAVRVPSPEPRAPNARQSPPHGRQRQHPAALRSPGERVHRFRPRAPDPEAALDRRADAGGRRRERRRVGRHLHRRRQGSSREIIDPAVRRTVREHQREAVRGGRRIGRPGGRVLRRQR